MKLLGGEVECPYNRAQDLPPGMAKVLNYYQLLHLNGQDQISPSALRQAYRKGLLRHHPDKQGKNGNKSSISVDDIALAYQTLSDPDLRAEYDRWLASDDHLDVDSGKIARPRHTGLETVDLDDLAFDPASGVWSRSCRCGDVQGFTVTEAELEKHVDEAEIITGCKGCSLWLRILFGVEE